MLIIEIALGIVLGWLIITNFEALLESLVSLLELFFKVFFSPFKLLMWMKNLIFGVISNYKKPISYALISVMTVAIVTVVGLGIFSNFVSEKNYANLGWSLFGIGIIVAYLIFFKDMLELLSSKSKKNNE
jgi:hypothetical protein